MATQTHALASAAAAMQAVASATTDNASVAPAATLAMTTTTTEQPTEAPRTASISAATASSSDVVRATRLSPGEFGTPPLRAGDRLTVPVSFYYCTIGHGVAAQGDGGGFCGAMRDGSVVYNGAAACDVEYLGQRFRIEGDPLGLIYRCADTGSAVHGQHRDIWFGSSDDGWAWQRSIGQAATIEVLP